MNKTAIYTAIFNNYDNLPDVIKEPGVDYIAFSDTDISSDVWKVIKIVEKEKDAILLNRMLKMNGHSSLYQYDYTLYIDGNVSINEPVLKRIERILSNSDLSCHAHHRSERISDDIYYMYRNHKISLRNIPALYKQRYKYYKSGFTYKYFIEANIIYRKKYALEESDFGKIWFDEFTENCRRDQISLCYAIWKSKIDFKLLPCANVREPGGMFEIKTHKSKGKPVLQKLWNRTVTCGLGIICEKIYTKLTSKNV